MLINKFFSLRIIFGFFLILHIPFVSKASLNEIELQDTGIYMSFVKPDGKIYEAYLPEFIAKTGANGNIQTWDTFKTNLNNRVKKGIAGEVAAKFFFSNPPLNYQILEDHYNERLTFLKANLANENGIYEDEECTTKKGPDNGIDGLFFLDGETIEQHSHIVINEAKFRNKLTLSTNDFGFIEEGIQQSHSQWNRSRFSWPSCLPELNYDKEVIIRTATLLNRDGTLKLYEVRDKGSRNTVVGEYASEAPMHWNIRKAYDIYIQSEFNH